MSRTLCFLAGKLGLVLFIATAAFAAEPAPIRIYDGWCLQGNGQGKNVTLHKCNAQKNQKWGFASSQHTMESYGLAYPGRLLLGKTRYVLRNAEHPWLCLDVYQESTANGTPTILWPCHGRINQQWVKDVVGGVTGHGWLRSGNGKCLNVAGHSKTDGAWLIIWDCIVGADNEIFYYGDIGFISNQEAADFGFEAFARCKENSDACKLNPDTQLFPPNMEYGFHTGLGWGGKTDDTLDFGDRYSLDRCSKAHDCHYWSKDDTQNSLHYIECLRRVLPGSPQDLEAHALALGHFSRTVRGSTKDAYNELPARDGDSTTLCTD